jgi:hypothetical protein
MTNDTFNGKMALVGARGRVMFAFPSGGDEGRHAIWHSWGLPHELTRMGRARMYRLSELAQKGGIFEIVRNRVTYTSFAKIDNS